MVLIIKNYYTMKNFAEINQEFRARNAERKAIIWETKLRAIDIVYEKATMEGIVTETKFFKGKCPKNALANFRQEMNKDGYTAYKCAFNSVEDLFSILPIHLIEFILTFDFQVVEVIG